MVSMLHSGVKNASRENVEIVKIKYSPPTCTQQCSTVKLA